MPGQGDSDFVSNEVLSEFIAGATAQQIARLESQLQLTLLETQNFALTRRTLRRYRIDGGQSARTILLALRRFGIVNRA
jgi:hypothetical protein